MKCNEKVNEQLHERVKKEGDPVRGRPLSVTEKEISDE